MCNKTRTKKNYNESKRKGKNTTTKNTENLIIRVGTYIALYNEKTTQEVEQKVKQIQTNLTRLGMTKQIITSQVLLLSVKAVS